MGSKLCFEPTVMLKCVLNDLLGASPYLLFFVPSYSKSTSNTDGRFSAFFFPREYDVGGDTRQRRSLRRRVLSEPKLRTVMLKSPSRRTTGSRVELTTPTSTCMNFALNTMSRRTTSKLLPRAHCVGGFTQQRR